MPGNYRQMFDAIIPQYRKIATAYFQQPLPAVFHTDPFVYIRLSFPTPGSGIFSRNHLYPPGLDYSFSHSQNQLWHNGR